MAETPKGKPDYEEIIFNIPVGQSVLFMPDVGTKDKWGDLTNQTPDQVLTEFNWFIQSLNAAGVRIIGAVNKEVALPDQKPEIGRTAEKILFVVEKTKVNT